MLSPTDTVRNLQQKKKKMLVSADEVVKRQSSCDERQPNFLHARRAPNMFVRHYHVVDLRRIGWATRGASHTRIGCNVVGLQTSIYSTYRNTNLVEPRDSYSGGCRQGDGQALLGVRRRNIEGVTCSFSSANGTLRGIFSIVRLLAPTIPEELQYIHLRCLRQACIPFVEAWASKACVSCVDCDCDSIVHMPEKLENGRQTRDLFVQTTENP